MQCWNVFEQAFFNVLLKVIVAYNVVLLTGKYVLMEYELLVILSGTLCFTTTIREDIVAKAI